MSAISSMPSSTSSSPLISACMSSRSNGVTKVASSRRPIVVADLVAAVLGVADLARPLLDLVPGAEHRLEQPSRPEDVRGVLDEQVEEAFFARDQTKSHGDSVAGRPIGRSVEWAVGVRCSQRGPVVILFIVLQAVLLAFAIGVAIARGRALEDIREATEARATGADLGGRVRKLIEEAEPPTSSSKGSAVTSPI